MAKTTAPVVVELTTRLVLLEQRVSELEQRAVLRPPKDDAESLPLGVGEPS